LAHQLATARARRDTVTRRLDELDRLDAALSADIAREQALQGDAEAAIAQLDQERAVIEQRLADSETQAGRIAAELTKAAAASREAEAALAELLARQAAMRAERRVAEAALDAATAQLVRTETERDKLAQQLEALGDGADQFAAREAAEQRAEAATEAFETAE